MMMVVMSIGSLLVVLMPFVVVVVVVVVAVAVVAVAVAVMSHQQVMQRWVLKLFHLRLYLSLVVCYTVVRHLLWIYQQ